MPKKKSKAKNSVAATHPAAAAVVVSASAGTKINEPYLPGGEDLSLQRHDEETVLSAIYGEDFTADCRCLELPIVQASNTSRAEVVHLQTAEVTF